MAFPKFRFPPTGKIIVSSEDFEAKLEGKIIQVNMPKSDLLPKIIDSECVSIGGWKINVVSLIDSTADSTMILKGWASLNSIFPLKEPLVLLTYSTVINYARFQIAEIEPHWTRRHEGDVPNFIFMSNQSKAV